MISSKSEFELEESCLILFDLDTSCSILFDFEFADTLGLGSFGDSTYKFGPDGNKGPDIADKFSVLCLSKPQKCHSSQKKTTSFFHFNGKGDI